MVDVARLLRQDCVFLDHALEAPMRGIAAILAWCAEWLRSTPDLVLQAVNCIDAGDMTVSTFQVRGTNTGTLGVLPATNERFDLSLCEVLTYDADGRIVSGEYFYDMLGIMTQLGHLSAPPD
jgi:steroid delta-isomerase-like uncharacterized protein